MKLFPERPEFAQALDRLRTGSVEAVRDGLSTEEAELAEDRSNADRGGRRRVLLPFAVPAFSALNPSLRALPPLQLNEGMKLFPERPEFAQALDRLRTGSVEAVRDGLSTRGSRAR
jgi:hypothetical protein